MTGIKLAGEYRVKRRGAVAYIALEGASMIGNRLKILAAEHGVTEPLPFIWRDNCPSLISLKAADEICAVLHQADVERRFGVPLALIWIDTVITAGAMRRLAMTTTLRFRRR